MNINSVFAIRHRDSHKIDQHIFEADEDDKLDIIEFNLEVPVSHTPHQLKSLMPRLLAEKTELKEKYAAQVR